MFGEAPHQQEESKEPDIKEPNRLLQMTRNIVGQYDKINQYIRARQQVLEQIKRNR